jgi:hypothetical protein
VKFDEKVIGQRNEKGVNSLDGLLFLFQIKRGFFMGGVCSRAATVIRASGGNADFLPMKLNAYENDQNVSGILGDISKTFISSTSLSYHQ